MKKIDEIFKEGLDQKGLEYSDAQWANMENLLDESNKGAAIISKKWYLLGLVLVLGSFATYFGLQKEDLPHTAQNMEKVHPKVKENALEVDKTVAIEKNDFNNTLAKPIKNNNNSSINSSNSQNINISVSKNNNPFKNKPSFSKNSSPQIIAHNEPFNNKKESVRFNIPNLEKINENELERVKQLQIENEHTKQEKMELISSLNLERNIALAKPSLLENKWQSDLEKSLDFNLVFNGFNNPKWTFHLSPYAENFRPNNISFSGNLESKNREESFQNTWGYGLQLAAKKKHFVFKAGLGYQSIHQTTNYESTRTDYTYDTALRLEKRNYETDGRGKWVALIKQDIDSTAVISKQVECPNCAVRFQYLIIPLSMQYEARWKQFTIFGEVGTRASFLTGTSGVFSTYGPAGLSTQNLSESGDAEKVVLAGTLQAGLKVPVAQRIQLWGSYGISKGINSRIQSYEQKDGFNMLRFGLEYRL